MECQNTNVMIVTEAPSLAPVVKPHFSHDLFVKIEEEEGLASRMVTLNRIQVWSAFVRGFQACLYQAATSKFMRN